VIGRRQSLAVANDRNESRAESLSQMASARFRVMESRRTFRPVSIAVGGRYRIVTTVLPLLDEWPDHRRAWWRAEIAVLDAFNDAVEPEVVRSAFLVAADEAHLQYLA
jgi:hypothetical protein